MIYLAIAILLGYLLAGQVLLRIALKRFSRTVARTQSRLLQVHFGVGLAVVVATLQMLYRPGDPGPATALKVFTVLPFVLAAGWLPHAQYRKATAANGVKWRDIMASFVRSGAVHVATALVAAGTPLAVVATVQFGAGVLSTPAAIAVSASAALAGITLIFVIYPYLIRLLHRGRRLQGPELLARLEAVSRASATPLPDIYCIEDRLQHASAMVTGLLPRHRFIFVSDALVREMSPAQVSAIVAHELAHIKHGDVRALFLRAVIGFLLFLVLATGARSLALYLGMPDGPLRVMLTSGLVGLIIAALYQLPKSRERETNADVAAGRWVGQELLGEALVRLYEINARLGHSGRMARLLSTHPDLAARLQSLGTARADS